MKVRFVPFSWPNNGGPPIPPGNIQPENPTAPVVSGLSQLPWLGAKIRPARFLEGVDYNDPPPAGVINWEVQGVSPQGRTAIFTNVADAQLVYTALINFPSMWDAQFRAAFVAYLASEIALPIWTDKDRKFGMQVRNEQMLIAKKKIEAARVTDGNEMSAAQNVDIPTDWMNTRRMGWDRGGWGSGDQFAGGGAGIFYGGCDGCCGAGETSSY